MVRFRGMLARCGYRWREQFDEDERCGASSATVVTRGHRIHHYTRDVELVPQAARRYS